MGQKSPTQPSAGYFFGVFRCLSLKDPLDNAANNAIEKGLGDSKMKIKLEVARGVTK